jgi:ferrous iron transport protein B
MGAIKREMNNVRWFWIAIGYQCGFAYLVALCIYQIGALSAGGGFKPGSAVAILTVAGFLYTLFRPAKKATPRYSATVPNI